MNITPYIWVVMAVGAQFIWACGNYLDKFLLKRYHHATAHAGPGTILFVSCFTTAIAALCIALAAGAAPYLGYSGNTALSVSPLQAAKGLLVGVVQVSWMVAYLYALDETDETESVPLFQSVPVFALLIGIYMDEIPPLSHITGSLIIIVGALVLNVHLGTMRLNKSVVALMLTASFLVALAAFLFKQNAVATNYLSSVFWMKLGMTITGLAVGISVPSYRKQFFHVMNREDWDGIRLNVINEVFDRIARLIFFAALLMGPTVMSVQSTAAYQPLFILLIGFFLAKNGSTFHAERYKREELIKKVIGVLLIGLGSYFIFFSSSHHR